MSPSDHQTPPLPCRRQRDQRFSPIEPYSRGLFTPSPGDGRGEPSPRWEGPPSLEPRAIDRRCLPVEVPSDGWTGTPGSGQRSAPARPRPSPPWRGRGRRSIHARRRSSPPTVEPSHGGDEGAPPRTAIHDRFTWSLGPKIPFPRDGMVPASFDTIRYAPPRSLDGLPELVGEGQTRRPACAAARWADAPLYATRPARLESIYDGPDPGTDGTA